MSNEKPKGKGVNITEFLSKNHSKPIGKELEDMKLEVIMTPLAQKGPQDKPSIPETTKDTTATPKPTKKAKGAGKPLDRKPEPAEGADGLCKPTLYLEFCTWMATPETIRTPKTQGEFATLYKVSENTLTAWKKRTGFWRNVQSSFNDQWRSRMGLVMQAMFQTILKKGGAKEVQLYFQLLGLFDPKVRFEDETPMERRYEPEQLAELSKAMRHAGFEGAGERHRKMVEAFLKANTIGGTDEEDESE